MPAGGVLWFARHELRLSWRDWRMLASMRGWRRTLAMVLLLAALVGFMHLMAAIVLHPKPGLAAAPGRHALVTISGLLLLSWSLMLSQAIEAVTRVFYVRADMDLILSSPVAAWRLFAVRIAAMAVTVMLMSLALAAPFVNVLAWRGGARWLSVYPAVMALAMIAVSLAIVLTAAMFRMIGPKRTRLIAQIVAAFIGALFAISLQFAAIMSLGRPDRLAFLQSDALIALAPEPDSPVWGIAHAVMGWPLPLLALLACGVLSLGATIAVYAPRFGSIVLQAAGAGQDRIHHDGQARGFVNASPPAALRRKEWTLLRRDPWLVSQTLVQFLYLLPAAFLLWRRFHAGGAGVALLVPVLVTAAGQFAGGLAWLAISGEDAPDLIRTAPVRAAAVLRARFEAVLGGTMMVFSPFLLVLAIVSPRAGIGAAIGIVLAGAGATAIQYWYRLQAHRGRIRRRQTASRFTTYAEALSSVSWAATATLAVAGEWPGFVTAGAACVIVGAAWLLSPANTAGQS